MTTSMTQWITSMLIATMTGITNTFTTRCRLDFTATGISTYRDGTHTRICRTSIMYTATEWTRTSP